MVSAAARRGAEDEGGVVAAVAKLAGCVESESEGERYGESEADEGECERGVVDSDVAFGGGRCTCEGGRGMATLGEARTGWAPPPTPPAIGGATEVEGDEALEEERRCVGWKYGSCADNPIRLSTGSPNCAKPRRFTFTFTLRRRKRGGRKVNVNTYPPSVLDQLFPVYLVEPRYPDELALSVDEAVAQLFVFAAHGLEHVL